jgi:TDG/mug DNA glycosylase family protein
MKILFVGINPSPGTYRRRIPFSNNKIFWYHLSDAGLIAEPREQLKDDKILRKFYHSTFNKKYHYGLINLIDRPSQSISQLRAGEEIPGKKRLLSVIKKYHPHVVCFVGKATYEKFIGKKIKKYGWQPKIGNSKIYVMHSPLHSLATTRIRELKKLKKEVE